MIKNIFRYNKLLKPLCEYFTEHSFNRLISWEQSFVDNGFKYPNRHDFYYKCDICGYVYFNNKPSKEDIEYIKEVEKKDD